MLLSDFVDPYHQVQTQLQQLQVALTTSEPSLPTLGQQGQVLLQFWQQHLATLTGEDLPATVYRPWRSLHTELHRELRLLNVDLLFLGNSRATSTKTAKIQQIGDRLNKLTQYCQQILNLAHDHKPEA